MSADNLRRQVAELREQMARLMPSQTDADWLRERFEDPAFEAVREQLVEQVLATGFYSFEAIMPDDEVGPNGKQYPSRFIIHWLDHGRPPIVIHIHLTNHWRDKLNTGSGRESLIRVSGRRDPDEDELTESAALPAIVEDVPEQSDEDAAEYQRLAKIAELQRQIAETQAHMDAIDAQIEAARQRSPAEPEPYPPRRHPLMGKRF